MNERRFNRFLAPIFGVVVGVLYSAKAINDPDEIAFTLGMGAIIGFSAGFLILLFDQPNGKTYSSPSKYRPDGYFVETDIFHRIMGAVSLVVGWLPIIGPILAFVGFLATRKCRGWPRVFALIGLVSGIFVTVCLFGALILHELDRYNLSQD